MPTTRDDSVSGGERPKLDSRYIGKFILWAVIVLVGWSFYSTMHHETRLAVIEQELKHIDEKIEIHQALQEIQEQLRDISR